MALPERKTPRLRFGHVSSPGASYFVTLCTKDRVHVLTLGDNGSLLVGAIQSLHAAGDIELLAATIMPDHIHLLVNLGSRLRIGQVMGKFKTLSRNHGKVSWRWQDDGFEHQIRPAESIKDYGFYIFMNPYRAGLCPLTAKWPWWLCPKTSGFRFLACLDPNPTVPQEWLGLSDKVAAKITSGD